MAKKNKKVKQNKKKGSNKALMLLCLMKWSELFKHVLVACLSLNHCNCKLEFVYIFTSKKIQFSNISSVL